jgi:hypothetical protein
MQVFIVFGDSRRGRHAATCAEAVGVGQFRARLSVIFYYYY